MAKWSSNNAILNKILDGVIEIFDSMPTSGGTISVNTGLVQALTNEQLRATPVPISGNITTVLDTDSLTHIIISTKSTNATVLKNSAGVLSGIKLNIDVNTGLIGGTNFSYLKIYDKATSPTHTDTPKLLFKLSNGADFSFYSLKGVAFSNGLSIRITRNVAINDNSNIEAEEVVGSFVFD